MSIPTSRTEFKEFCMRALGAPVINIELADEQIEDKIDVALRFYYDYHYDGSSRTYYKHVLTQEDLDNQFIILPENIIGAVKVFPPLTQFNSAESLFDINYQIAVQDLLTLQSGSLIPYYMAHQHLGIIREMLVTEKSIRFNRHRNKLFIDTNWNKYGVGEYVIVEAHEIIDAEEYPDVWGDRWLQNYCIALMKEQWGSNLGKFIGVNLIGGTQFNAERIINEGQQERLKLEDEIMNRVSAFPIDFYG